jgi:hypothetical protein
MTYSLALFFEERGFVGNGNEYTFRARLSEVEADVHSLCEHWGWRVVPA